MRTFVFQDRKSHKFWHIELKGDSLTVTFGRVGTNGQTQTKGFADEAKAKIAHDKLVAEKVAKGYVETTAASPQAAVPARAPHALQAPLEAALVENPDEATAHSAYADYLVEEGDPRGEFMQVQLALEEAGRSADERRRFRQREKVLLALHHPAIPPRTRCDPRHRRSRFAPALAALAEPRAPQLHVTTYGDDICPRLIASGILKRLKTLDIGYGNLTDDGARELAACADLKKLDVFNVSRNALTSAVLRHSRRPGCVSWPTRSTRPTRKITCTKWTASKPDATGSET